VYAVDGFLTFSFSGNFSDWRDKTFIKSDKNSITSVRFIYPADSSFSLVKEGSLWKGSGLPVDSVSTTNYLSSLEMLNGQSIKDNYNPVISPVFQLMVEGNNLLSFSVKCYKGEVADEYILNSSQNPDVYFTSNSKGIFEKLFKPSGYFSIKKTLTVKR
jgi:hypothetical protein